MKIATYLINLDGSDARLATATAQMQQHGIAFERIAAVDGRKFAVEELAIYDKKRALRYMGRDLVGGELGCYMSHIKCAEAFLASNAEIAIVLEDDMQCGYNFLPPIIEAAHWLEQNGHGDWQVINFGNQKLKISTPLHAISSNPVGAVLHAAHYFPMTTTGLVWSRTGATEFLKKTQEHRIFCPVDNFLRYWQTRTGRGYCFAPALVRTTGTGSEIDHGAVRKKHQRAPYYFFSKQARLWHDKYLAMRARRRAKVIL